MSVLQALMSKSNIEWCEAHVARYAYSSNVSELENTLSSFVYLPVAAYLMLRHSKHNMPFWFYFTEIVLCVVGVGSAIFHGTETYLGELLDEVPMTFLALGYLMQREDCHEWTTRGSWKWMALRSSAVGVAVLSWILYLKTRNFEVFKVSFVLLVVMSSGLLFVSKAPPSGRTYLAGAFILVVLARTVWEQERSFFREEKCPTDEADVRYHFHSFWHLFTALSHMSAQWYSMLQLVEHRKGGKSP
uniref:Alkaline ceramidase n=1 Tax=Pinguiococcus pyrenoidosus TaxID=172671 RepID=A0A7R9YDF4_9STRA|mmetsp:Transcript_2399/g.10203  ORF Transcript_2399/g.10203 Transcript_2399/m.10203 type:complete len:245 (+) Transcript_2399:29-763(+)